MSKHFHPTETAIAVRAHQIYIENGCQPGHDLDHWLQAEYELRQLPVRKLPALPPPKRPSGPKSLLHVVRTIMLHTRKATRQLGRPMARQQGLPTTG